VKVYVYCNTSKNLLSVKALEGKQKGRVVAHVEHIMLKDVEFRVQPAGRRRTLETKRKTVHAGAVGTVESIWGLTPRGDLDNRTIQGLAVGKPWLPFSGRSVRYNPYETEQFMSGKTPVSRATRVKLDRCTVEAEGLQ
jgi:hypothetical protein